MGRYMIKNGEGLYSRGGYPPVSFDKKDKAKIWNGIGAIKNHLNLQMGYGDKVIPSDWKIVEVQLIESDFSYAKELYEGSYIERRKRESMDGKRKRREYLINKMFEMSEELKTL